MDSDRVAQAKTFVAVNAKAFAAFAATVLLGVQAARGGDTAAGAGITIDEWLTIAITACGLSGTVWSIANRAKPTAPGAPPQK